MVPLSNRDIKLGKMKRNQKVMTLALQYFTDDILNLFESAFLDGRDADFYIKPGFYKFEIDKDYLSELKLFYKESRDGEYIVLDRISDDFWNAMEESLCGEPVIFELGKSLDYKVNITDIFPWTKMVYLFLKNSKVFIDFQIPVAVH